MGTLCEVPGCDLGTDRDSRTQVAVSFLGKTLTGWACSPFHGQLITDAWARMPDRLSKSPGTWDCDMLGDPKIPDPPPSRVSRLLAGVLAGALIGRMLASLGYVAGFVDGAGARPLPPEPDTTTRTPDAAP